MNAPRRLAAITTIAIALASCGGGGGGSSANSVMYSAASGVAQKGPLQQGSTVTAQELDASLSPTGKQYTYQVTSDLGTFSPTSAFTSQYIGLNASGYYFDEVVNAVSGGTITLNGYSDLSVDSVLNVNLLTTLAYQRIHHLLTTSGMTFASARTQAESEVLAALHIPAGSYGAFGTLDLSKSTDGDHILAAISSLFVYGNTSGNLSALIAAFQSDIGANGTITNAATLATLAASAKTLDPAWIATNLTQRYSSEGVTFTAADISDWIDQEGDGVVGKFRFQVAAATQSSNFSFPSFVAEPYAGRSISVSSGQLYINGAAATGPATLEAGDAVSVSPPPGVFPNGVRTIYLLSGSTRISEVSFSSALTSISITPVNPTVPFGFTRQLLATGTFSDGSTADLTQSVNWDSSSSAAATVSSPGLVTGMATGSATITATAFWVSSPVSGSTTIAVGPLPPSLGHLYVASASGSGTSTSPGQIQTYGIASDTGALLWLGPNSVVPTGMIQSMASSPNKHFLYAADSNTITTFSVDASSGLLSATGAPVALPALSSLTLAPSGKFLFAASSNWATPEMGSIQPNQVTTYSVDSVTGALTSAGSPISLTGTNWVSALAVTPDSRFIYFLISNAPGSTTSATVQAYAIDPVNGALTPGQASSVNVPNEIAGVFVYVDMLMDPLGRFLYLTVGSANSVDTHVTIQPYAIDSATGSITAVGAGTALTRNNAAAMQADPTGKYLYVLDGYNYTPADDNVMALSMDPASGALTPIGPPVTLTDVPGYLVCDPTGRFVYIGSVGPKSESPPITPSAPANPTSWVSPFLVSSAADTAGQLTPGSVTVLPPTAVALAPTAPLVIIE
jgi:6-phosphogluconolactonase (cycloisomerase 2 family)/uncharacterized protein YjdB